MFIRRFLLPLCLLLTLESAGWGAKQKSSSGLAPDSLKVIAIAAKLEWLGYYLQDPNEPDTKDLPLSADKMATFVGSPQYLVEARKETPDYPRQVALVKKYQKQLKSLIAGLSLAGSNEIRYFDNFMFTDYKGKVCLCVSTIMDDDIYDTNRTTSHGRAADVFNTYAQTIANKLVQSFGSPKDIDYFAVTIVYGAGDRASSSRADTVGEVLNIIATTQQWGQFAKLKLADQQFADKAEFLLMGPDQPKLTRVQLKVSN